VRVRIAQIQEGELFFELPLSLQATMPPFLPGLVDRRFLWGGFGLFTSLDTDIAALLSGPDAGRWTDAIGDALSSTHRRAPREMQRLEDEPDLKRGPGGLRDLRRAI
jgi:UTP:GlnB (protein PII) uridylyltransferase